jgi:hypothetical protein
MFTDTAHCTIITARNHCSGCYLKQDPLHVSYTAEASDSWYRKKKFRNMTPHARTDMDEGQLTGTVCGTARGPHFSLDTISVTVQLWT